MPNDRTKPHFPRAGHDAGRRGAARGGGGDLAGPSPHHGRAFPARRADRCAGPHPLRAHGPGARPVDHRRERVGCGRHAGRRQGRARSGGRLHAQHRPTTSNVFSVAVYNVPYDVLADFEPVGLISSSALMMIGRADLPASNLRELIQSLKANPHPRRSRRSASAARAMCGATSSRP